MDRSGYAAAAAAAAKQKAAVQEDLDALLKNVDMKSDRQQNNKGEGGLNIPNAK